jgi:hypothetical protein
MVRLHSVGVWRTLQRPCFAARAVIHEQGRLYFSPATVRNAWSSSRPRRIIVDKPARRRASTGDSGAEAAALEHRYRWLGIPVGSVAGLFGSLVGVGGGVIMVPMMTCRPLQFQVRGPTLGRAMHWKSSRTRRQPCQPDGLVCRPASRPRRPSSLCSAPVLSLQWGTPGRARWTLLARGSSPRSRC